MTTAAQGQGARPIQQPPTPLPGVTTPVAPQPQIEKTHKQEIETSTNNAAVLEFKKMRALPTPPTKTPSHITTDIPRKGQEIAQVGVPTLLHHPVLGQVSTQQKSPEAPLGTPEQNKELVNAKNQLKAELNNTNALKTKKEELEKKPELTAQDRKEIAKLDNALQLSSVNSSKASIRVILAESSMRGTATPQEKANIAAFLIKGREAHKAYTESSLKLIRSDIAAINKNAESHPAYASEAKAVTVKYQQLETQHRTIRATEHRLFSPQNDFLDTKIRTLNGDINALPGALKADPATSKPATATPQPVASTSNAKPLPTPPQAASTRSAPAPTLSPTTAPKPPPIPLINLKSILEGNAKQTAAKIDTNIKPPKEAFSAEILNNQKEELPSTKGTREAPFTKEKELVADALKTMDAVNKANGKRDGKLVATQESFKAGDRSLFSAFNAKVESMVRFSDVKALQKANKSLDEGIAAQQKITDNAKIASEKNPNSAALKESFKNESAKLEDLQNAHVTLNKLKWAQGVAQSQTYQVSTRRDLENATAAIQQTQAQLNVHTPTPRVTIDEAGSAPPIGKFENLNAANNLAKELITGSDPTAPTTQAQLKTLDDQNKALLKSAVDEATKPIRYPITPTPGLNNTQATIDRDLAIKITADRVGAEASSVSKSVANDPELKAHADALKSAYDNKKAQLDRGNISPEGKETLLKDLRNLSESLAMVESQHIHKLEAAALSKPEQVSARAAAETTKELNQLKAILEAVKKESNTKVVLSGETLSSARQGTRSSGAEGTADHILGKIPTDLTHPDVNKAAKEVIDLVKGDPRLSYVINSDPARAAQLRTIEDNIKNAVIVEVPINVNNKLLNPPADASFQHEFLTTYRSIIKEFTGDKGNSTESAKLFNYINTALKDPQVPLYAKQQLLKLTDEWVNDSYINSGEVAAHKDNLKEVAKTAASEGSPTLKALSEKITASLPNDKLAASAPAPSSPTEASYVQATDRRKPQEITSTSMLLDQIASGNISVGSKQYKEAVNGLATSMKSQSAANFTAISSSEFKNGAWVDNYKNKQAPNLTAMMQEPNDMNFFVRESLMNIADKKDLTPKKMQEQAAIMVEFFVDLQQAIQSPQTGPVNYNLMMGIQTALSSSPELGRMPEVLAKLPSDKKSKLEENKELLSPLSNYKNLRQAEEGLKNSNTPFIPYIGMRLGDITFAHEGNPSVIKGNDSTKEQLNGFKVKLLGGMISGLNEIQKNIPPTATPSHNLSDINNASLKYTTDFTTEKTTLNATRDKLQLDKEKNKDELQRIDARLQEIEPIVQEKKQNEQALFTKSYIMKPRPTT